MSPARIRRAVCYFLGHAWTPGAAYAPRFYVCRRCGDPGMWVDK